MLFKSKKNDKKLNSIIKIHEYFYLSYILSPGKKVYFLKETINGLVCVEDCFLAYHFDNRVNALLKAEILKSSFDLDFNVEKVGD